MTRLLRTKEEIEQLLVAEVRTFATCENVSEVVVVRVTDPGEAATWTVSCFKADPADGAACERALQEIVPRFQQLYDMSRLH
jgi:hypothetical protein